MVNRVIKLEGRGLRGLKGDVGDVNPQMPILVAEAEAARDEAEQAARAAALSAATAESAAGPTYPDTAAGLAATSDGEAFAVDNGDGTVTVWLNDGGVAVEQRTLATTAALASDTGATLVGAAGGLTVQAALDSSFLGDRPFRSVYSTADEPIGTGGGLINLVASRNNSNDLMKLTTFHEAGAICYSIHVTDTAEVGNLGGGAAGFAMSGPGTADSLVANRYGDGAGNAALFHRRGSGDGAGLLTTCSGSGYQDALFALKQNGGATPAGYGHAAKIQNISNSGYAIFSQTSANNVEAVSNVFSRLNITGGIVIDIQQLLGGTRTAEFSGNRVIVQPATSWGGAFNVNGFDVLISANVTGSPSVRGVNIANNSAGNTNSYGVLSVVTGANTINTAGYFQASGGTNNIAIKVQAGDFVSLGAKFQMANLYTYADNAAASAALAVGTFYKTSTGEARVVV